MHIDFQCVALSYRSFDCMLYLFISGCDFQICLLNCTLAGKKSLKNMKNIEAGMKLCCSTVDLRVASVVAWIARASLYVRVRDCTEEGGSC